VRKTTARPARSRIVIPIASVMLALVIVGTTASATAQNAKAKKAPVGNLVWKVAPPAASASAPSQVILNTTLASGSDVEVVALAASGNLAACPLLTLVLKVTDIFGDATTIAGAQIPAAGVTQPVDFLPYTLGSVETSANPELTLEVNCNATVLNGDSEPYPYPSGTTISFTLETTHPKTVSMT